MKKALDVIKQLKEKSVIPISRAQMRVRLSIPNKDAKRIKDKLNELISRKEDEDWGEIYEVVRSELWHQFWLNLFLSQRFVRLIPEAFERSTSYCSLKPKEKEGWIF